MAVSRSEEYYFPRDNLVIQVEDTLFRLHSGILELHSGFFRDMFTTPSSEAQEGTSDEHPLRLPSDLCSAESFTTLCKIICPKVAGVFPPVLVKEFVKWEPVLNATEALQMTGVQRYILARLQDNPDDIKSEPVRLLSWAMRSEPPLETLMLECYCALAYRRRPPSDAEMSTLGYKTLARVVRVREKIRFLLLNSTFAGSLMTLIPTPPPCTLGVYCQSAIYKHFVDRLLKDDLADDSENEQDNSNIFQVSPHPLNPDHVCCSQHALDALGPLFRKAKLDDEVRRCVLGASPPSAEL